MIRYCLYLKTLYKFKAINITLGLKYLRVSPDHGVAFDKILKKKPMQKVCWIV